MNIKVKTSALVKVAKLNGRNQLKAMPILGHIKFEEGTATASNLSISITVTDKAITASGFVDAAKVAKGLDIVQRNFGLVNNKEFTAADYPDTPALSATTPLNEATIAALLETKMAASEDDTRPILTGLYLNNGAVTATDGYRLMSYGAGHKIENVILPGVIADLLKLTKEKSGWSFGHDEKEGLFTIEGHGVKITGRTITGNYPEWEKLIPDNAQYEMRVDVAPIIEALSLVENGNIRFDATTGQVLVIDGSNADRSTETQKAIVSDGTHALNKNHLHIIMPLKDSSAEAQTLINGRYFKDAAGTCKTVKVQFNAPMSPINIETAIWD